MKTKQQLKNIKVEKYLWKYLQELKAFNDFATIQDVLLELICNPCTSAQAQNRFSKIKELLRKV